MGGIDQLTEKIIGCAMKVHSTLGFGFLESGYHRSMEIEPATAGVMFESEKRLNVFYADRPVGHFMADLYFAEGLIVELKAIETVSKVHEVQLVNYLVASGTETGLLLNFGAQSLQIRRKFKHAKGKPAPANLVNLE